MADRSLNDLNYGRPGLAYYNLEDRGWTFSRQPPKNRFIQVASWRPVVSASTSSDERTLSSAAKARRKAKRLVRDHAHLVPASEQLNALESVSEAILSATETYDPAVGSLWSFGSVFLERSGTAPKRIAALPAGEACNILRLVVLREEKHGWGTDKTVWLSGPSFKGADSGYWNEDAAPIQQVCFAQTENGNSFLAVRLPMKTVIFNPFYHRGRRAAKQSSYHDLPPSLIDAHSIATIHIEQTGGAPHTDVAFNPDYQFQVGIVDQQNAWSIWDIERQARDDYKATCLVRGNIHSEEEMGDTGEDGWARILWAGDVNTVLVCNRRHLSIVDIKGPSFVYLPSPELFSSRSPEWILDIQRHPKHNNRFFILTSTHVLILSVTTSSAAMDMTTSEAGAAILLSRRHYRGDEDFTLQLSVQLLIDDEVCVFLHSRANDLVQVYHFQENRSGFSTATLSMDPILLDIHIPNARRAMQLQLDPLRFGTQAQLSSKAGPGHSYMEAELRFYQLSVMLPDLSVHQTIVYFPGSKGDQSTPVVGSIEWDKVVPAKHSLYASKDLDDMRDFIVPNGLDDLSAPASKAGSQALRFLPAQALNALNRVTDHTLLYTALNLTTPVSEEATEVNAVIDHWAHVLTDSISPPCGTLTEALSAIVTVADVDNASTKLQLLSTSAVHRDNLELRRIASAPALRLVNDDEPTMSSLYDAILFSWIASLPAEVPVRIRQHKERLARRIAAEVMLASSRIRSPIDMPDLQSAPSQDGIMLPVLPSAPLREIGLESTSQWSSQSQRLPSSSVLPSSQPPSSPLVSEFSSATAAPDPLARLRQHLQINDDNFTVIPQSVTQLLTHWQLGADPRVYDWDATERAIRPPDSGDETSQEQREKERRRRERREKRQKREDELMRAKTITHPSFPRSSPGPMFGDVPSSSQVPSQMPSQVVHSGPVFGAPGGFGSMVPQSQVEPGRFGGRPDKKKKKGKGRISGF